MKKKASAIKGPVGCRCVRVNDSGIVHEARTPNPN